MNERSQSELEQLRRGVLSLSDIDELKNTAAKHQLSKEAIKKIVEMITIYWREELDRISSWGFIENLDATYVGQVRKNIKRIDELLAKIDIHINDAESNVNFKDVKQYLQDLLSKFKINLLSAETSLESALKDLQPISDEISKKGRRSVPPAVKKLSFALLDLFKQDGKKITNYDDGSAVEFLDSILAFLYTRDAEASRYGRLYSAENLVRMYSKDAEKMKR